jgi:hypothetical protein
MEPLVAKFKRSRSPLLIGAVVLLCVSAVLIYLAVSGKTRTAAPVNETISPEEPTSTPVTLVPRRLDGVLVPQGQEAIAPRAVMVENFTAARPLSGPALANVAIEAPAEGGITRFVLFFDASTTASEIGPVRSARPYFVDWVQAWNASYFHVGGSPDALQKIKDLGAMFANIDEMHNGASFWRSTDRQAPHNAFTSQDLMTQTLMDKGYASGTAAISWHYQDAATSTDRGDTLTVKIPYGGAYNVTWKYDKERGVYRRYQAGTLQTDKDGTPVESENVIVIKTDAQVLDTEGRLKIRTVGSGDAMVYRDGKKYIMRWQRSADEPIKFESTDGSEFLLTRGRTWIEVTTDDRIFAGLGVSK